MKYFLVIWGLLLSVSGFSQTTRYPMTNGTVRACDGIFEDSNNGQVSGRYDHNERLMFTVCVPGADYITFRFSNFCTEKDIDYLVVWNGKDTLGTKIGGPYSGTISIPTLTSSDSCVTFYFHSDKSVSCDGWEASWETTTLPLTQPRFRQAPQPTCSSSVLRVRLDQKFNCNNINDSSFRVSGVLAQSVSRVVPLNCDGNNETDSFEIQLSPGLNKGGGYRLDFESVKYDFCDSPWVLRANVPFSVDDCPIVVELTADNDTVCEGSCTQIHTDITGGDSARYQFQWNNGITRTYGPVNVCPTVSGFYKLRVSDGIALPGEDSIYITVLPKPVAPSDTTLCQSAAVFQFIGTPSGGVWSGKGITNSSDGSYLAGRAGAGIDTVVYRYAGCTDTTRVTIRAIFGGPPNAACPGSGPFMLYNYSPTGGTWSGTNVDASGRFTPQDTGVFTLTYTWNGCVDTKQVIVRGTTLPRFDTVCLSKPVHPLNPDPRGGIWSGRGFLNSSDGLFYPSRAGIGDHVLVYRSGACRDTLRMTVKAISAGPNLVSCPFQDSFLLSSASPPGGLWKGRGISDSTKGYYNPSFARNLPSFNDTLIYTFDGCEAKRIVYVRHTVVYDTYKEFCIEAPSLLLDWAGVRSTPGGGIWTGPGAQGFYFNPSLAGHGLHKLYYTANGCVDSIDMRVHPESVIQNDTVFCVSDPAFRLLNAQGSGVFRGAGITDSLGGEFNPGLAGPGLHKILYFSSNGCRDSVMITVTPKPLVRITPPQLDFCHTSRIFSLQGTPTGALGIFDGAGTDFTGNFIPSEAGTGMHWVYYTFGTPTCLSRDSVRLRVLEPLIADIESLKDTLCEGESVVLNAVLKGGLKDQYTYNWNTGSSAENIFISPLTTTTYQLIGEDGCSDPDTVIKEIVVNPAVKVAAITSEMRCFGTLGYAEIDYLGQGNHLTLWQTNPPVIGNRLNAEVGLRYRFTVTNTETGCRFDSSVMIPGFSKIRAYFITNPNNSICLNNLRNKVDIINMSSGGITGIWNMGDGTSYPYDPAVNPSHRYSPDSGSYTIWLHIENEGGCKDSFSVQLCMTDSVYSFIPNAFSPGNDGMNDRFLPMVIGASEYELEVYNRWGERVFRTETPGEGWDGTYLGKDCPKGAYHYIVRYKGRRSVRKLESGVLILIR